MPDLVTTAKGLTSGTVPMGAVMARKHIHDAIVHGAGGRPEKAIELFHGYTYSAHPLACAAALATLETYKEEGLFERADELAPYWEERLHSLRDGRNVIDIRNIGLMGAIELEPAPGQARRAGLRRHGEGYDKGLMVRITADTIAMSPPLIVHARADRRDRRASRPGARRARLDRSQPFGGRAGGNAGDLCRLGQHLRIERGRIDPLGPGDDRNYLSGHPVHAAREPG